MSVILYMLQAFGILSMIQNLVTVIIILTLVFIVLRRS